MTKPHIPEQVTLVDSDGNAIGHKERTAMDADDMSLAVVMRLTNKQGDILIARRNQSLAVNPGLWSAGAEGMVTYGDTIEATAVREVKEELGLEGIKLEKVPGSIVHGSSRGKRYKIGFRGMIEVPIESLKLQTEEVAEVKVVTPDALVEDWQTYPEKYVGHFGQYLQMFGLIEKA